jgi:hypothetical protein
MINIDFIKWVLIIFGGGFIAYLWTYFYGDRSTEVGFDTDNKQYISNTGVLFDYLEEIPDDLPIIGNILLEDGSYKNMPVSFFWNKDLDILVIQCKPLNKI